MNKILIFCILFLAGCNSMTNEEIIEQTKLCNDNDMQAALYTDMIANPVKVVCHPKEDQC